MLKLHVGVTRRLRPNFMTTMAIRALSRPVLASQTYAVMRGNVCCLLRTSRPWHAAYHFRRVAKCYQARQSLSLPHLSASKALSPSRSSTSRCLSCTSPCRSASSAPGTNGSERQNRRGRSKNLSDATVEPKKPASENSGVLVQALPTACLVSAATVALTPLLSAYSFAWLARRCLPGGLQATLNWQRNVESFGGGSNNGVLLLSAVGLGQIALTKAMTPWVYANFALLAPWALAAGVSAGFWYTLFALVRPLQQLDSYVHVYGKFQAPAVQPSVRDLSERSESHLSAFEQIDKVNRHFLLGPTVGALAAATHVLILPATAALLWDPSLAEAIQAVYFADVYSALMFPLVLPLGAVSGSAVQVC